MPDTATSNTSLTAGGTARRRVITTVIGGVGVVCAAALVWWLLPYLGVPVSSGPLEGGALGESTFGGSGYRLHPGSTFTYGMAVLRLPAGHGPATITSVHVDGLQPGVRYLGARLGAPDRQESDQVVTGFPPGVGAVHATRPLRTPVTATDGGWELYLGFQITRPGAYVARGLDITYRLGGRTYRTSTTGDVAMCTPAFAGRHGYCPTR